jgi:hypothetical protein
MPGAEDLDEDRLGLDPLERGIEPPERWSGADRFGTTPREEHEGPSLDQRLAEEEPDSSPIEDPAEYQPDREAGADETEYQPDREAGADETEYQPEQSTEYIGGADLVDLLEQGAVPRTDAERRGQAADAAGGSVAEAMRTPDEEER